MRATQPSERHARAALLGALACIPADVIFVVFLGYMWRIGGMPARGTGAWSAVAMLALALFTSGAIARVVTPLTYLLWLHRAYSNALTLATAGERGTTTAHRAVIWKLVPHVQLVTGLVIARRLDVMSQAGAGSPAWWVAPWWIAAMVAVWSELVMFFVLVDHPPLGGGLILLALGLRWLVMPATVLFIRRIERLQRERAERRDWADVF